MNRAEVKPWFALLLPVLLLSACDRGQYEARAEDAPTELASASAVAQDESLPASLLRRLGEAADGYRTGLPVWIVADPNYPHDVQGVYGSDTAADSARLIFAPDYEVYGPYRTETDFGRTGQPLVMWCKRPDSRWCEQPGRSVFDREQVLRMTVLILLANGDTVTFEYNPDSVEAFFTSFGGIERLVIPYYSRLNGIEWTQMFYDSLRADIESSHR